MKVQRILVGVLALGLLFALTMGLSLAQGRELPDGKAQPMGELAITSMVTSTISYQGMLTDDGSPVDGSRDMVFRLYSDDACSAQVGGDIDVGSVSVNDGFFDVDLPVDHDNFTGRALWLEAEVGGTAIGCEEIQPVPYALGLRPRAVISGTTEAGGALLTAQVGDVAKGTLAQSLLYQERAQPFILENALPRV